MANSSTICSTFVIKVIQDSPGAETINIANPGRTFEVHEVYVQWQNLAASPSDSTVQVSKVSGGGAVSNLFSSAVTGNRINVPVYLPDDHLSNNCWYRPNASSVFESDDNIRITTTDAATKVEVHLYCIGNPAQSLTVT